MLFLKTYLIKAVDVAGNQSANALKTEQVVAQPPDFVLNVDHTSTFTTESSNVENSTFTNCIKLLDPSLGRNVAYLPVPSNSSGVHSETWGAHFIGTGDSSNPQYETMQALTGAGYTSYLQGNTTVTEGSYVEIFNYGTDLASSKVTQHIEKVNVGLGSTTNKLQIDTAPHDSTSYSNGTEVSGSNKNQRHSTTFGRVRYTTKMTATNGGIAKIDKLNLRLDAKTKTDTGSGTAVSTEDGGTTVDFNLSFIDIQGIVVTPKTTSAVLDVVDFVDIDNPTSFQVFLYDTSGTRAGGAFTWTARGF